MKHDLDYILMLVQCGEISRSKARELIEGHESEFPRFEGYFGEDEVPMETVEKAKVLLSIMLEYHLSSYQQVFELVQTFLQNPEGLELFEHREEISIRVKD